MNHYCTKCSAESGATIQLEAKENGILVCRQNPKHRFRLDQSGSLRSADL